MCDRMQMYNIIKYEKFKGRDAAETEEHNINNDYSTIYFTEFQF
jgi:hypothetical protein